MLELAPSPKIWLTRYGRMFSKREEGQMWKTAFTEEHVTYALRHAESGIPVACRKLGNSEQAFYRWKKKFVGMSVAELASV